MAYCQHTTYKQVKYQRRPSKSLSPPNVGGKFRRRSSFTSLPDLEKRFAGGRFCDVPATTSVPIPSWITLPKNRKITELKDVELQTLRNESTTLQSASEKPNTAITANNFNNVVNSQLNPSNNFSMAHQRCASITDEMSTVYLKSLLKV